MQPLLFKLVRLQSIRSVRQVGNPRLLRGGIPLPAVRLTISGVTRDDTGAPLGNCSVKLFRTSDNVFVEEVTSDGSGNYTFFSVGSMEHFHVSYKVGTPDVAGTTVRTLVGVNA